jgi:uncharacterized membrane protein HdeD (DUF308 family)
MDAKAMKPMWEALVVRGVAGILFGIAAVFWPGLTLVTLVYIFSIYVLLSGVIGVVQSILDMTRGRTWFMGLIVSIIELGIGLYLVRHPQVTFATFILLAGLLFIARGVFEIVIALTDESMATNKVLLVFGGILSALLGIILLMQPVSGGVAFVWVMGLYALISGPILIALGIDAKHISEGKKR